MITDTNVFTTLHQYVDDTALPAGTELTLSNATAVRKEMKYYKIVGDNIDKNF